MVGNLTRAFLFVVMSSLGTFHGASAQTYLSTERNASEPAKPQDGNTARLFGKIKDVLNDITEKRAEIERSTSDDSLWFWPGSSDQEDRKGELKGLLDAALTIAVGEGLFGVQAEIDGLQLEIPKLQAQRLELQEKLLDSPESSLFPEFMKDTTESLKGQIAGINQTIRDREAEIGKKRDTIRDALSNTGLALGPDQLAVLLSGATSRDIVKIVSAYQATESLDRQLEALMKESADNPELSRKYFAMHTALFAVVTHAYDSAIEQIDNVYIIRLGSIRETVERAQSEAESLLVQNPPADRRARLTQNLDSLRTTLRVASMYQTYLTQQRDQLSDSLDRAVRDLQVAENTLTTLDTGSQLLALVESTEGMLSALRQIDPPSFPELSIGLDMKQEFESLTERLQVPSI